MCLERSRRPADSERHPIQIGHRKLRFTPRLRHCPGMLKDTVFCACLPPIASASSRGVHGVHRRERGTAFLIVIHQRVTYLALTVIGHDLGHQNPSLSIFTRWSCLALLPCGRPALCAPRLV